MVEGFRGLIKAFVLSCCIEMSLEEGVVSFACSLFFCAWYWGRMDEPCTDLPLLQPVVLQKCQMLLAGIISIRWEERTRNSAWARIGVADLEKERCAGRLKG